MVNQNACFYILAWLFLCAGSYAAPPEFVDAPGQAKKLEKQLENKVKKGVEKQIQRQVAKGLEKQLERNISAVESAKRTNPGQSRKLEVAAANRKGSSKGKKAGLQESGNANAAPKRDIRLDVDGNRFVFNQHLLLVTPEQQAYLEVAYGVQQSIRLANLDLTYVRLNDDQYAAWQAYDQQAYEGVTAAPNHLYRFQSQAKAKAEQQWMPAAAMSIDRGENRAESIVIGMVDSAVDLQHAALQEATIRQKSFVREGAEEAADHGTAVASIFAGQSHDGYRGVLPGATILNGSVFEYIEGQGVYADTESIVNALNWLAGEGVAVVNMSLAGPPNPVLKVVVNALAAQHIPVVAAAGNGGPGAPPAYPAAYDNVIAVTAVDNQQNVYYLANRGEYIDFAAPGVGIYHAMGAGYSSSSGTSYAAPFVSALIAVITQDGDSDELALRGKVADLGKEGRDPIFGFGLVPYYYQR